MMARMALACLAVLLVTGCTSTTAEMPVRSEYDKTTSFQEWESFRFATDGTSSDYTRYPRYERMVQQALEEELTARGYSRIEDGTPDFRVAFELIFRGEKSPHGAPKGVGADPLEQSSPNPRQRGVLIVKMLHPTTGEILWTGQLSEIKMTSIEPQKELKKAVWRILVEFPPITG